VGMAIGAAAFEGAVIESDASTASIALFFLPVYLLLGIVGVILRAAFCACFVNPRAARRLLVTGGSVPFRSDTALAHFSP
jgi:hypothetical protein